MNNHGTSGITAIALMGSILVAGSASTLIMQNANDASSNYEQIISNVFDEITTYLKINEILGKYYTRNGTRSVERIVIQLQQLIDTPLSISDFTLKLTDEGDVVLFGYSGHAAYYTSTGVFANPVWDITTNAYSLIIITDKDHSIADSQTMNGDSAFLAFELPEQFKLGDDATLLVSILPNKGITRSITLQTPCFHISDIINFRDV